MTPWELARVENPMYSGSILEKEGKLTTSHRVTTFS